MVIAFVLAAALHAVPAAAVPAHQREIDRRPGVRELVVTFWNPVVIGDRILMGKYVIEHDTDRMARGRPCTYIYDWEDMRLPVVAFRCKHLKREPRAYPSVTLGKTSAGLRRFTEFQFAGETGGHGVPVTR